MEEYLRAFPTGRFALAAQAKLRQLRREEAPRSTEGAIRLGQYRVQGTNPNGTPYAGTVTIERVGALYKFQWHIGRDVFQGQGTLHDRVLTIDWGQADPVIYQVLLDGTLEGTWARGQGTERLHPE